MLTYRESLGIFFFFHVNAALVTCATAYLTAQAVVSMCGAVCVSRLKRAYFENRRNSTQKLIAISEFPYFVVHFPVKHWYYWCTWCACEWIDGTEVEVASYISNKIWHWVEYKSFFYSININDSKINSRWRIIMTI